jgi:hypothetical protein
VHRKKAITASLFFALGLIDQSALAATPTNWVTTIDVARYNSTGTITFNDWGYTGPNGVGANDFAVTSPVTGITGFDPARIGQTQNVLTLDPDWKTPDPAITSYMTEFTATTARPNTSQDAQVNFFRWTYTTGGGSTFNNMQIDKAGNYFVARNDMNFMLYENFVYHDTTGAPGNETTIDSNINFQPYAVTDALGWCGSTLNSDPNGVGIMAGQVSFGVAFDVYMGDTLPGTGVPTTQLIPNFVMRSYGSYVVNIDRGQYFVGSAVMNNNNPELMPLDGGGNVDGAAVVGGAALDPDYQNRVSFLGAGVIPKGAWVTADSYVSPSVKKLNADGTWDVQLVEGADSVCDPGNPGSAPVAGAVCAGNFFAGYAFLMRADGQRTLTFIAPDGHSDYLSAPAPVPLPAAAWLFGPGLLGLMGFAWRRKK